MEKDPANRYQSAKELISSLEESALAPQSRWVSQRWQRYAMASVGAVILVAATATLGINLGGWRDKLLRGHSQALVKSLAVLPLANLTGDSGQEYFVDGMTDELTTNLAQIGSLRVTSRTSTMQFKDTKKPVGQIAGDLNVDAVVEGSVMRSGDRMRITAQLIDAKGDRHLWAKSYERKVQDALALQDEVTRDIAEEIRIKLNAEESARLVGARPVNPEAYDDYLRGRFWWSKRNQEGEWKGLEYFQKAIAKDPNYAMAYAGVADSFIVLGHHGRLSPKEALPKAEQAATKALELDDSLAEAHTSLALVKHSYDWDWSDAEREFKRAIALNPNYATAHHWYSHYLVAVGRLDEAVTELERARDLDPFSPTINAFLGETLYYARRYDDSLRQFRRSLEMYPDVVEFHDGVAKVYEQKNMFVTAFSERQQVLSLRGDSKLALALAQAYKQSGYKGYLQREIESLEQAPKSREVRNLYLAHMYAVLNDQPHTLQYLERAYEERDPWLLNLQVDPAMDAMRSSSRFRDLVRRIGLPQL
jgi:TolB-like protein/Tfp pilus assembly protein PilF